MVRLVPSLTLDHVRIFTNPRRFIASLPKNGFLVGRINRTKYVLSLLLFYFINVALLFLTSIGLFDVYGAFIRLFVLWCFFSYVSLVVGLWVTGNWDGYILPAQTMIYNTAIYLAVFVNYLFVVGYLVDSDNVVVTLVQSVLHPLWVWNEHVHQNYFVYVETPPESLVETMSVWSGVLVFLALLTLGYYVYAIYLSCRLQHRTSRLSGMLVTIVVTATPIWGTIATGLIPRGSAGPFRAIGPIHWTDNLFVLTMLAIFLVFAFAIAGKRK